MRETKIETYLHARVTGAGGTTRKWVSPGHNGVPDRIVIWPLGRIHFIETKAPKKGAKPHQVREHWRLQLLGCIVKVINTKEQVDFYVERAKP